MSPDAGARAVLVRDKSPPSASGGARASPPQRLADQRDPVIAEIHIVLVDEDGGRTKSAARHHLVGIGLELILDRLLANAFEKLSRIDAETLADFRQHG